MLVYFHDKFVREEDAVTSVFDRGLLYGDGLFETIRVFDGQSFCWREHWQRLQEGADFLKIKLPLDAKQAREVANQLVARNGMSNALLRLTLSRGVGPPGYSPRNAKSPMFVASLRPASKATTSPAKWELVTSSFHLFPPGPLACFKTANKLPQVLARAEADTAGAHEALLLDGRARPVEGTSSNLFWIKRGVVFTPPVTAGILPGVTRALVLRICSKLKIPVRQQCIAEKGLAGADGVFLTLTSQGIVEARSLDGKRLKLSPVTSRIAIAYDGLVQKSSACKCDLKP